MSVNSRCSDSDMDETVLSESTLRALEEFYNEQQKQDHVFQVREKSALKVPENWNLSQFWYTDRTASVLAQELLRLAGNEGKIACLCCPTTLKFLFGRSEEAFLFEYDRRFQFLYGEKFQFYDLNKPCDLNLKFQQYFDVFLIDPPFLSYDCFQKLKSTVNYLTNKSRAVKIIICSGQSVQEIVLSLFGVKPCQTFVPEHISKLGNEFLCYLNYDSEEFGSC